MKGRGIFEMLTAASQEKGGLHLFSQEEKSPGEGSEGGNESAVKLSRRGGKRKGLIAPPPFLLGESLSSSAARWGILQREGRWFTGGTADLILV